MERLPPASNLEEWEDGDGGGEEGRWCRSSDCAVDLLPQGKSVVVGECVWVPKSCVFFPVSTSLYNNSVHMGRITALAGKHTSANFTWSIKSAHRIVVQASPCSLKRYPPVTDNCTIIHT